MLTDLDKAIQRSGLEVVHLDGWRTRKSNGGEDYQGVLVHHTGSYDDLTDAKNDLDYAWWMAKEGRRDLPPPLCNLSLSAELRVYLTAAGNANHAGAAKASGPMPAASDGSRIYIGIEAMNSGSQGWGSTATLPSGEKITYFEGYARLCASICYYYGWPASHVRAHKETSVTGKWDPGLLDMDKFRNRIAAIIEEWKEEDDMPSAKEVADEILAHKIEIKRRNNKTGKVRTSKVSLEQAIKEIFNNVTIDEE
jgi:hypothetical protein